MTLCGDHFCHYVLDYCPYRNKVLILKYEYARLPSYVNLLQDVSSICKDSDDDEFSNEESLKKKEQLILLKEVSYETLGKAWPENKETQGTYMESYFIFT